MTEVTAEGTSFASRLPDADLWTMRESLFVNLFSSANVRCQYDLYSAKQSNSQWCKPWCTLAQTLPLVDRVETCWKFITVLIQQRTSTLAVFGFSLTVNILPDSNSQIGYPPSIPIRYLHVWGSILKHSTDIKNSLRPTHLCNLCSLENETAQEFLWVLECWI